MDGAVFTTVHTVKTSAGTRKAGLQVSWLSPDLKLLLNMILRNICAKNLCNICAKCPLCVPKKTSHPASDSQDDSYYPKKEKSAVNY